MNPVTLVAMPDDHDRIRNIVGALSESDLDIYWERARPGTAEWTAFMVRALDSRGLIFFWSAATEGDEAASYRRLAAKALRRKIALCVRLDGGKVPAELAGCTVYDLRGWRMTASSLFMLDLVAGVKAKAAGLDPPLPRAPRQLLFRRLALTLPAAVAALALIAGLYRDLGVDRVAGPEEARAWAAVAAGSCPELRRFLATHRNGVHAAEAQALLQARELTRRMEWRAKPVPLTLFVERNDGTPAKGEAAARQSAAAAAHEEASRRCRDIATTASYRLDAVELTPRRFFCDGKATAISCDVSARAVCAFREPIVIVSEKCGT